MKTGVLVQKGQRPQAKPIGDLEAAASRGEVSRINRRVFRAGENTYATRDMRAEQPQARAVQSGPAPVVPDDPREWMKHRKAAATALGKGYRETTRADVEAWKKSSQEAG